MIRVTLMVVAVATGLWAFTGSAAADDKTEMTLTGTLVCGEVHPQGDAQVQQGPTRKQKDMVIDYFLDDRGTRSRTTSRSAATASSRA